MVSSCVRPLRGTSRWRFRTPPSHPQTQAEKSQRLTKKQRNRKKVTLALEDKRVAAPKTDSKPTETFQCLKMSHSWSNHNTHYDPEHFGPGVSPVSWIIIAILTLTFLLGFPGNALVIWVTGLKMKRTVNTVWFLNLAIADFLCCLSLPLSIAHEALQGHWPYGEFLCKVLPAVIIFNMFASVFILVAISIDRCLLVLKPVWSHNHRTVGLAKWLCVGIWFLALLMCVPVFLYRETFSEVPGKTECLYNYGGPYLETDDSFVIYDDDFSMHTTFNDLDEHPNKATETSENIIDQSVLYDIIMTTNFIQEISEDKLGHSKLAGLLRSTDHTTEDLSSPRTLGGLVMFNDLSNDNPFDAFSTNRLSRGILEVPANHEKGAISSEQATSAEHNAQTTNLLESFISSTIPIGGTPISSVSLFSDHFAADSNGNVTQMPDRQEDTFEPAPHIITTFTRFIFGFVIPLSMILICYGFILHRVGGTQFSKSSGRTRRIVMSIVSAFFICWVPYHVIGIALLYVRSPVLAQLDHLSQGLAYANSCINPVLYVFTGQDFKDKMRKSLPAIFESAFSEDITRSTAPTRSKNSIDGNQNTTTV